jgi:FAD/FMN-containing dehydrogenase
MLNRRELLQAAGLLGLWPVGCAGRQPGGGPRQLVNDVHSQLNPTWVSGIELPRSLAELRALVRREAARGGAISVAGGRHAMGGQQFGTDTTLVDVRGLDRILAFDPERGTLEVEAGIQWPALVAGYLQLQQSTGTAWGFAQKQTGADRLTIAGTLACNAHGRALTRGPFVEDVESFSLLTADGELQLCSRTENPDLFALAAGGYGLFGLVYAVTLRLVPRRKLERTVEVMALEELMPAFESRIAAGFLYGDFQFSIDATADDFLRRGVFSCYRPLADDAEMPTGQRELSAANWRDLLLLAHTDKHAAFERYANYYLSTNGQRYWSDTHQMSPYFDGYHAMIDQAGARQFAGSEMITELYVPRPRLVEFLGKVGERLRDGGDELIYGTIRLIEADAVTVLPWARERYACVIFNLHVPHGEEGKRKSADAFRDLITLAIERGGSYYLTYHRHATREQVLASYPRFPEFLRSKRRYDPDELFQSDWYRHYRRMFATSRTSGA